MLADIVAVEKRPDAYAMLRMGDNAGIALGPAIGGFVVSMSYTTAFYIAAAGLVAYGLLLSVFTTETLPRQEADVGKPKKEYFGDYGQVLRDKQVMYFVAIFTLLQTCAGMLWALPAVYAKQNYQVPESMYGLIPTTKATMVVLFQIAVTRITKHYRPGHSRF